jgi:hypothetical protein
VDRDRCDLPVTVAIAILVLVTAAALVAVAVGVAGWLASRRGDRTRRWSAFALIFGAGLHITCWKPDTSTRDFARRGPASE